MRPSLVLGVILVALAGMQASHAASLTLSPREENRRAILAAEGQAFDAVAMHVVQTAGADGIVQELTVTGAQALDLQLDFLELHGIRLAAGATQASSPAWPLLGTIEMHERGWKQSGAACPAITPGASPEAQAAYDGLRPGNGNQLGTFRSAISEAWLSDTQQGAKSWIKFWSAGEDREVHAHDLYEYGAPLAAGWTLDASFEMQRMGSLQYFCRAPTAATGLVNLDGIVDPYVDRVDD